MLGLLLVTQARTNQQTDIICFYQDMSSSCPQNGHPISETIDLIKNSPGPITIEIKESFRMEYLFSNLPEYEVTFNDGKFSLINEMGNSISFSGPAMTKGQDTLTVSGDISVNGDLPTITLISSGPSLKIDLEKTSSSLKALTAKSVVTIINSLNTKTTLKVDSLDLQNYLELWSSFIHLSVTSLTSSFPTIATTPNLDFPIKFALDKNGIASLYLLDKFTCPYCKNSGGDKPEPEPEDGTGGEKAVASLLDTSKDVSLYLINQFPNQYVIPQSDLEILLSQAWTILTAPSEAIKFKDGELLLTLTGDPSTAPIGFKPNDHIFHLKKEDLELNDEYVEWKVIPKKNPDQKPFQVCYGETCSISDAQQVTDFNKMPNFQQLYQQGIRIFQLYVVDSFPNQKLLDLSWLNQDIVFQIEGTDPKPQIEFSLPTPANNCQLSLKQVSIPDTAFSNIDITLIDVDGTVTIGKDCLLCTDIASYSKYQSYVVTNLTLQGDNSITSMTFESDHWTFSTNNVLHEKVKNRMKYVPNLQEEDIFTITPPADVTTVRGLEIIFDEGTLNVPAGWKTVTSDIVVSHGDRRLYVVSEYNKVPFTAVGNGKVSLKTKIPVDDTGKPQITDQDLDLDDDDIHFEIDDDDLSEIDLDEINFTGKSSFTATNKKNKTIQVKVKRAEIQTGAQAQYSNLSVIDLMMLPASLMYGQNSSSKADIAQLEMKWVRNKVPQINVGTSETVPLKLSIKFDNSAEPNLNYEDYNKLWDGKYKNGLLIAQGDSKFDCLAWKKIARFESNISAFSSDGDLKFSLECKHVNHKKSHTVLLAGEEEKSKDELYMKLSTMIDNTSLGSINSNVSTKQAKKIIIIVASVIVGVIILILAGVFVYRSHKAKKEEEDDEILP